MPIEVNCPQCGRLLRAPDSAAGRRAKCPECAGTVPIPGGVLDAEEFDDLAAPAPPAAPTGGGAEVDYEVERPPRRRVPRDDFEDDFGDDFESEFGPAPPRTSSYGGRPSGLPGGSLVGDQKPCPVCGEMIKGRAIRCRYCGEDLRVGPSRGGRRAAPRSHNDAEGMAVASLVLGILSLTLCVSPITAPLAIIFGIVHQNKAKENGQIPSGLATAGIVCGIIAVVLGGLLFLAMLAG